MPITTRLAPAHDMPLGQFRALLIQFAQIIVKRQEVV
jgi:hypothetical protein